MLFAMSVAAAAALSTPERTLPTGRLLVGYATDRSLREDKVVAACRQGVNVVIWSFAHLEVEDDVPRVRPTFDVDAVLARSKTTRSPAVAASVNVHVTMYSLGKIPLPGPPVG